MRGFQLQRGEDAGAHAGRASIIGPGEYSDISRRQESGGGRKKLGFVPQGSYQEMADKPSYMQAYELAGTLMKEFLEGRVDKVELIYHHLSPPVHRF